MTANSVLTPTNQVSPPQIASPCSICAPDIRCLMPSCLFWLPPVVLDLHAAASPECNSKRRAEPLNGDLMRSMAIEYAKVPIEPLQLNIFCQQPKEFAIVSEVWSNPPLASTQWLQCFQHSCCCTFGMFGCHQHSHLLSTSVEVDYCTTWCMRVHVASAQAHCQFECCSHSSRRLPAFPFDHVLACRMEMSSIVYTRPKA